MGQPELSTYVTGLKTDVKQASQLDRKTVAERANMANISALDFLLDITDVKKTPIASQDAARDMFHLADELNEIADFFDNSSSFSS